MVNIKGAAHRNIFLFQTSNIIFKQSRMGNRQTIQRTGSDLKPSHASFWTLVSRGGEGGG